MELDLGALGSAKACVQAHPERGGDVRVGLVRDRPRPPGDRTGIKFVVHKFSLVRTLTALVVFILVHILTSSSLCFCHEESILIPSERRSTSRKLLATPMKSAPASVAKENKLGGGKVKEAKKAVEQSLRKAPPSVSNPIQN
ncbi:hypothetical protein SADUNF_Sadunf16G0042300 [Salix dunnii]|uniref:Uncharacterized protein n=1 Tax=Salix dunnii TaxID=1413687 RepID=A0A835MI83_9ROSI|nr:hypothetical protein SADUNF_Sadunf16G0042300 [Salix dunnii]